MRRCSRSWILIAAISAICGLSIGALGQGKGKGNSGGKGNSQNAGKGNSNGKGNSGGSNDTSGTVVTTGGSTVSTNGKGKGNNGKSNGNANKFNGLSKKTGASPEALDAWYERERLANPNMNHGRFTAAQMVGRNHNIPPQAILDGMRNGDSMGDVLRKRGLTDQQILDERRKIRKVVDEDRNGFPDYVDDDKDWNANKGKGKDKKNK